MSALVMEDVKKEHVNVKQDILEQIVLEYF
jgi:hypothetical protein